jgi:hypothetical protein
LLLKNQDNLATSVENATDSDRLTTTRVIGELSDDATVRAGGLLAPNRFNNVWEFIVVPTPQFFTAVYEVTIWTSYTTQMNQILEGLISSFLPQGNAWRLETKEGYWFVATVDGNLYSPDNNFDDMSQEERIIKYKFTVKVPGYILASRTPGAPVPVRRYISNPDIVFTVGLESDACEPSTSDVVDDPFLGADDPTLPSSIRQNDRSDQRLTKRTKLFPPGTRISINDPALTTLLRGMKPAKYKKLTGTNSRGQSIDRYVRVKKVNPATGETVYACIDIGPKLSPSTNPFENGFFVVAEDGSFVVDEQGDLVVFMP